MSGKKKFSLYTAIMVVVANMIGTGVFTSIGFQVAGVKSASAILLLWLIGGVISFFGAYSYAILGSFYKKNGGEYLFLKSACNLPATCDTLQGRHSRGFDLDPLPLPVPVLLGPPVQAHSTRLCATHCEFVRSS